jgi:hypothetical protein
MKRAFAVGGEGGDRNGRPDEHYILSTGLSEIFAARDCCAG